MPTSSGAVMYLATNLNQTVQDCSTDLGSTWKILNTATLRIIRA